MKTKRFPFPLHSRTLRAVAGCAGLALLAGLSGVAVALPYQGRTPANKLTASDAGNDDTFGGSVAISGNLAVIGARNEDGAGSDRGAAYVYDLNTGAELRKLIHSDAEDSDRFGGAVAISGNLAVITASGEDGAGINRGAAYVFDLDTGVERSPKLTASDAEDFDGFGGSVAISGDLVVIGAPEKDEGGFQRGAAYVYNLNNGAERKLIRSDFGDGEGYGGSVAISGDFVVVGARGSALGRGAVYVFDPTTGVELFKLTVLNGGDTDFFGTSVEVEGTLLLAGAPGADAAYVFDLNTGTERFKLTASDPEDGDRFGEALAISDNLAIIGAPQSGILIGPTIPRFGSAYVFDLTNGKELTQFIASDEEVGDLFGSSVAISGNLAIVGSELKDGSGNNRGAAYVFEIPTHQPDNRVGTGAFSGLGDNLYNTSAAGQTLALTSRNLAQVNGFLTVTNDGDTGDDYTVSANSGNANFAVRYLRRKSGFETNVTAAMIAGTHLERNVVFDEPGRVIRAEITPSSRLKRRVKGKVRITRTTFLTRMTSVSGVHDFKRDTAAISVRTQ